MTISVLGSDVQYTYYHMDSILWFIGAWFGSCSECVGEELCEDHL